MGVIGRISRFLLGGYLLLIGIPFYLAYDRTITFLGNTYYAVDYASILLAFGIVFVFLAFYLAVHRRAMTSWRNLNKWVGAALANAPPLAVFIISAAIGFGPPQIAVFTYVGAAMVLAGWRKDQGCEVMSPANAIVGRRTHFGCIVFSPIDWVEQKARSSFADHRMNLLEPRLEI